MIYVIRGGWFVVALVLGFLRLGGMTNGWFQAFAHLVTGGFFGAWFLGKRVEREYFSRMGWTFHVDDYLALGIALTTLEAIAFLAGVGKIHGR